MLFFLEWCTPVLGNLRSAWRFFQLQRPSYGDNLSNVLRLLPQLCWILSCLASLRIIHSLVLHFCGGTSYLFTWSSHRIAVVCLRLDTWTLGAMQPFLQRLHHGTSQSPMDSNLPTTWWVVLLVWPVSMQYFCVDMYNSSNFSNGSLSISSLQSQGINGYGRLIPLLTIPWARWFAGICGLVVVEHDVLDPPLFYWSYWRCGVVVCGVHILKYTIFQSWIPTGPCRWSYTEIHKVDVRLSDPLSINSLMGTIENTPFRPYCLCSPDNIGLAPYACSRSNWDLVPHPQQHCEVVITDKFGHSWRNTMRFDLSSLGYSAAPLVFDEEQHQSLTASTTSLDDESITKLPKTSSSFF